MGLRLVVPDHTKWLPVLRARSLSTCCRHYPGAATEAVFRSLLLNRVRLRGLLGVYSRYGLYARAVIVFRDMLTRRRFSHFISSNDCSCCVRLERLPGGGLHLLEKRRLITAHAKKSGWR